MLGICGEWLDNACFREGSTTTTGRSPASTANVLTASAATSAAAAAAAKFSSHTLQCHYWNVSKKDTRFLDYQLAGVWPCWMKLSVFLLLQSFRDFDCTESFLLEAVAAGAAPRVGSAAPRWCFRVLDGPLHPPPNRQKNTWQQLESGSLLILKPVDSVSVGAVAAEAGSAVFFAVTQAFTAAVTCIILADMVAVVGISAVAGNCAAFILYCIHRLLGLLCVAS